MWWRQRRAAAGQPEHTLKADGVVQVAVHAEQAPHKRVDPGHLTLAQGQPGGRIGGDRDVGRAAGGPLAYPGAMAGAPDFPRVAEITELDVVGGVEAGVGAQVPVRQGPKRLFDVGEAV